MSDEGRTHFLTRKVFIAPSSKMFIAPLDAIRTPADTATTRVAEGVYFVTCKRRGWVYLRNGHGERHRIQLTEPSYSSIRKGQAWVGLSTNKARRAPPKDHGCGNPIKR